MKPCLSHALSLLLLYMSFRISTPYKAIKSITLATSPLFPHSSNQSLTDSAHCCSAWKNPSFDYSSFFFLLASRVPLHGVYILGQVDATTTSNEKGLGGKENLKYRAGIIFSSGRRKRHTPPPLSQSQRVTHVGSHSWKLSHSPAPRRLPALILVFHRSFHHALAHTPHTHSPCLGTCRPLTSSARFPDSQRGASLTAPYPRRPT